MGWLLYSDKSINWYLTPRHVARAEDLVCLIVASEDQRKGQIARVLEVSEGKRRLEGYEEQCILLRLVLCDGEVGHWAVPNYNSTWQRPFHPAPVVYVRLHESSNPVEEYAHHVGRGMKDFWRECQAIRNGTSHLVKEEYKTLFGEEFPLK